MRLRENSHQGFHFLVCLSSESLRLEQSETLGVCATGTTKCIGSVYRARYYDPIRSRFISEDPLGLQGGLHLQAYVQNDPVNLIDPLGNFFLPGALVGGFVGVAAGGLGAIAGGATDFQTVAAAAAIGGAGGFLGGALGVSSGIGAGIGAASGAVGAFATGGNLGAAIGAGLGGAIGGAIGGIPGIGLMGIAEGTWIGGMWGTTYGLMGHHLYNYLKRRSADNEQASPCSN